MTTMTRKLTRREHDILNRLLAEPFHGRDELRAQIATSRVKTIEEYGDNYGSIEFEVTSGPMADVDSRVPIGAMGLDSDGVPIDYILHVVDGFVKELEVVKADGSPISTLPSVSDLEVSLGPRPTKQQTLRKAE